MKIYFIRHGETQWNRMHKLQGRSDIPLNDAGLAGARIASRALLDVPFDLALSSPLARAYKTAEIIAEPHGLTPHRVDLLKEMSFGTFEGTELETENPDPSLEEKRQALRHWFEHPSGTVRLPEGENVRDVKDRSPRRHHPRPRQHPAEHPRRSLLVRRRPPELRRPSPEPRKRQLYRRSTP